MPIIIKHYMVLKKIETYTRAEGEEGITRYLKGYKMYLIRYMLEVV